MQDETQLYGAQHSTAEQQFSSLPILSPAAAVDLFLPERGNLKLQTLEEGKRRNLKKELEEGKIDSDINRRQERGREIFVRKEISGEGKIRVGQRSQQTMWRCAHEKEALTWLRAIQLPAVALCGLLHICSTQRQEKDNVPPVVLMM